MAATRTSSKYKRKYTSGRKRCSTHFKHRFQLIPTFTQPSEFSRWHFPDRQLHRWQAWENREERGKKKKTEAGPHIRPRPRLTSALIQARSPRFACRRLQSNQKGIIAHLCAAFHRAAAQNCNCSCLVPKISAPPPDNNTPFALANEFWKGLFMDSQKLHQMSAFLLLIFQAILDRRLSETQEEAFSTGFLRLQFHLGPVGVA